MRTRGIYPLIGLVLVAMVAVLIGRSSSVDARLQTDSGTPVSEATPGAATPVAPDAGIVTLVLWYQQNNEGSIVQLSPIKYDGFVATRDTADTDAEGGRVVWEEDRNDGNPRVRIGADDYFDAYAVYPDDPNTVQRWIFFDDDSTLRPATMVMQIKGIKGQYDGWEGTATFISRGEDAGGILVLAIRPPK